MAQPNIKPDPEEILPPLSDNREVTFRNLPEASLNRILAAESAAQLGAERCERRMDEPTAGTASGSAIPEQNKRCSTHSKVCFRTEDAQTLDSLREKLRALEQHKLLAEA